MEGQAEIAIEAAVNALCECNLSCGRIQRQCRATWEGESIIRDLGVS